MPDRSHGRYFILSSQDDELKLDLEDEGAAGAGCALPHNFRRVELGKVRSTSAPETSTTRQFFFCCAMASRSCHVSVASWYDYRQFLLRIISISVIPFFLDDLPGLCPRGDMDNSTNRTRKLPIYFHDLSISARLGLLTIFSYSYRAVSGKAHV